MGPYWFLGVGWLGEGYATQAAWDPFDLGGVGVPLPLPAGAPASSLAVAWPPAVEPEVQVEPEPEPTIPDEPDLTRACPSPGLAPSPMSAPLPLPSSPDPAQRRCANANTGDSCHYRSC